MIDGKSAVEWIIDRYEVSIHKDSKIKNDPNDYLGETGDYKYIVNLLKKVINVSVQSVEIINNLPKIEFE